MIGSRAALVSVVGPETAPPHGAGETCRCRARLHLPSFMPPPTPEEMAEIRMLLREIRRHRRARRALTSAGQSYRAIAVGAVIWGLAARGAWSLLA